MTSRRISGAPKGMDFRSGPLLSSVISVRVLNLSKDIEIPLKVWYTTSGNRLLAIINIYL